jgi:uncharacterized RDD family membrane protein YckC
MTSGTCELSPAIAAAAPPPASAELSIRLAATAIDAVIVGTTATVAAVAVHLAFTMLPRSVQAAESLGLLILAGVVATGYFVYFWGIEGRTPGQRMLGLCVTRPRTLAVRRPIGVGRAFLRFVGMTAGNAFFVDLLVAFLHRDRRALHDLMADSIVVPSR